MKVKKHPDRLWRVPREWVGERCFILCGGPSLKAQRHLVPKLKGRVLAVKHGVVLRPDADALFISGERTSDVMGPLVPKYLGPHLVLRGRIVPEFEAWPVKYVGRLKDHSRWSDSPSHVAGYDSGTSAINLAMLFGATEIVLLGYDMTGGRWFNGEIEHYMPRPPESHFSIHMTPLPDLASDAKRKGVRIVNVSPISKVTAFERGNLEDYL